MSWGLLRNNVPFICDYELGQSDGFPFGSQLGGVYCVGFRVNGGGGAEIIERRDVKNE